MTAMRLHHRASDRQTDAGSPVLARTRGIRPVEALEQPREVLRRDTDAGVADLDLDGPVVPLGGDDHRSPGGREPHRVVEQVEQDLVDALAIGVDGRQVLREVARDRNPAVGARHLDLGQYLRDERPEGHLLTEQRQLAGFEPREL